jgi:phosphopentomutase
MVLNPPAKTARQVTGDRRRSSRAPFSDVSNGFPAEIVSTFETRVGRRTIGNIAASGTAVIDRYGPEHQKSGDLILYTSADSVFQLAAHRTSYPGRAVPRLYGGARCSSRRT